MVDLARARDVLIRESEARLALKAAKAREFLRLVSEGMKSTEAWQVVALSTIELERKYEAANVERLVLWIETGVAPSSQETV